MSSKVDWYIHLIANGVICADCGEKENNFLPYACNAHTHGMDKYGHPDFQLVLKYHPQEIMRILNLMGLRVQSGEKFRAGDYVKGIYEDCDVRLDEFEEEGRQVLRVIVPDKYGHFPEDPKCNDAYRFQTLKTDELYISKEIN